MHANDSTHAACVRTLLDCVRGAGKVLLRYFGRVTRPRQKEGPSSIVCDADLAAEEFILDRIARRFPRHNIISEESGRTWKSARESWVIDPLDGTSNFVAGIPWFGVQIGLLHGREPVMAAMYLPVEDVLYFAEAGQGAYRNGSRVAVTRATDLQEVLCAFGFDPGPSRRTRRMVELLFQVSRGVRNTRATNSLVDFCYTIDGRLGGCLNMKTRIWDIVPVALLLPEAGGVFTDLRGRPVRFEVGERAGQREYAVVGASRLLHPQLLARIEATIP